MRKRLLHRGPVPYPHALASRKRTSRSRLQWLPTFSALLAVLLVSFAHAAAQVSQATVRGSVRDSSGAVIPSATLTLTNTDTHVATTTTATGSGAYLFENVNPGNYTLEASANGFARQRLTTFPLEVNQTATLDFKLTTGQVSEVVNVEAEGVAVEASTTEVGLTLDKQQLENLPVDSRNFTALTLTAPGVSPVVVGGSQTNQYTTEVGPAIIPSFNGQSNRSDIFVVDGILDDETFGNAYAVQPIMDAIQNMKLESHNDSAEFGGSTGGTINLATKSGTNQFHGEVYEFYKEPKLQSVAYFGTGLTGLHQNQFGANIGGPVIIPKLYNGKNRTFFFGAYEGFRFSSPNTDYFLVPTAAQLAGNFQADSPIFDPATTTCNAAGNCARQQFAYQGIPNTINPARIAPGSVYYAKYALPQATGNYPGGNNAFENAPSSQSFDQYTARVDQTFGDKDSVFFRIMGLTGTAVAGRSQLPGVTSTTAYSYIGSWQHVFTPTTLLHIQGGRTYESRPFKQVWTGVPADFGSNIGFPTGLAANFSDIPNATAAFNVDNHFSDLGDFANPEITAADWSLKGDYTQVVGRNTLKFGAEFNSIGEHQNIEWAQEEMRSQETNSLQDATLYPGGNTLSGDAVASFLIGVPGSFTRRDVTESLGFGGELGLYAQTSYQASNALTLNFGLRYDVAFIPRYGKFADGNEYTGNFNFSNGTYIVYHQPPPCAVTNNAPCIPTPNGALPDHVVLSPNGSHVLQNQYNNLQPRLGVAYRIDPKTALRAGFGIAFDEYAGLVQNIRGVSGNWPSVGQIAQTNINAATPANPFPGYTVGNLPALTALPAPTPFNQFNWFIDPNAKPAYSLQYNFGLQRQIAADTVVSATYVGSGNRHLNTGGYWNVAATPGPGDPTLRRPYPYIQPTYYTYSGGAGNYNALQLQLQRSFHNGLASTLAYTWSKSMDEGCSGFFGSEGCSIQQVYNISTAEYSVSAFDVPNNFVGTVDYQLPIGRGRPININNIVLDQIVGGWQMNAIGSLHSGTPYNINLNQDIANIGNNGYERPNRVGNPNAIHRTLNQWINPAAFAVPAEYTYGNLGRNALRSQFSQNYDLGIFKDFVLHENLHARINFEAFNFINHPIFGAPASTLGVSTFGTISSTASEARTTQMSAKITF